jgi:ectoine hydroxylase-related dioxygenase (phytanoyl-CoA dioxygenase family)
LVGWSEKEGAWFVQLPAEVLSSPWAVRLQLDDFSFDASPLRVLPGSHREGRLAERDIARFRQPDADVACEVNRGGVLAMRPLLLHATYLNGG